MQKGIHYTTILHQPRIKAGLTCNEYVMASTIFHMQNNQKTPGWCYATKEWFSDLIGVSKQSIINLINELSKKGFVTKSPNGRQLQVTEKWSEEIEKFDFSKESLPNPKTGTVKKVYQNGKESLPNLVKKVDSETVKKVYPIIILDNNTEIDRDKDNTPDGVFSDENLADFEKQIEQQKAQELFEAENGRRENERIAAEKAKTDLEAKAEEENKKLAAKKKREKSPAPEISMFSNFDEPEKALVAWMDWEEYKDKEKSQKYKTSKSKKAAIENLQELSRGNSEMAQKIINQSMAQLWAGLFSLRVELRQPSNQIPNHKIIDSTKYEKYAN